jgi:transcriptional regulator with XRE-family HTH domain
MDDERRVRLAYAIRAARERRGMTPQQLADAAGVAHSTVYGWESGDKAPSILMLGPLCDALGVSPDLFRDLPEEPPSPVEAYLSEAARQGVREGVRRRRQ